MDIGILDKQVLSAILANTNEDIHLLLDTMEKLPPKLKKDVESILKDIQSLSSALEILPDKFDEKFTTKINQLVEITEEIDKHSASLAEVLNNFAIAIEKKNEATLNVHLEQVERATQEKMARIESNVIREINHAVNKHVLINKFWLIVCLLGLPISSGFVTLALYLQLIGK